MKLVTAFLLLSLYALGALVVPSGEASEPRILTEARYLNRARRARINAEIGLQESIVNARQSLLDEGYAAPLEVDSSKVRLLELRVLHDHVREYEAFLDEVSEACQGNAEPATRPHDRRLAIGLPTSTAFACHYLPWVVESSDELRSLSRQLATARVEAQGKLRALATEETYLESLLSRLRDVDDDSLTHRREIELTEMRLAIQRRRIQMGRAQKRYEACLEVLHQRNNWDGFPIELKDEIITNPRQLSRMLQWQWHIHRVEAEREALVAHRQMQSTYRDRLLAIEDINLGRPGEAWLWEFAHARASQELALLDHRLSHLYRFGWPAAAEDRQRGGHLPAAIHADLTELVHDELGSKPSNWRISVAIADRQRRISALVRVAAKESVAQHELKHARLELAAYQAELQVAEDEQTLRSQIAQFVQLMNSASLATRSVSSGVVTPEKFPSGSLEALESRIVSWFKTRSEKSGKQNLAKCRIELSEWILAGLRPLRELEYATWKEVAIAERQLARARADALAAWEERRIVELEYKRVLAAVAGDDASVRRVAVLIP